MAPVVRFAPSPTGLLHIGNARPALFNALYARRAGGRFLLRLDDTDAARSTAAFAAAIEEDLAWLGIVPDGVLRQSDRIARYDAAAARLRAAGRLYPAYETPDELERRRRRQLGRGQPPVYDRSALRLGEAERAALAAEGRRPHWRFRLDPGPVTWDDLVRGPCHVEADSLSDPVLVREDGSYLYTLPSVVDDAETGVTHVIRGEDHVTNTAVQIQIFRALGAPVPVFAHHNLLTTASGEGLSKRLGHLSLRGLREAGYEPGAVASLAVLTGSAEAVRPVADLDALAGLVDLAHVSRAPAKFDAHDLDGLNARLVHDLPFRDVALRLAALGVAGEAAEAFWGAVRANLTRVNEAAAWWAVVRGPVTPVGGDALLAQALARLPDEPWGPDTWKAWTEAVRAATGLKGKALFLPLRLALTGLDHGPDLAGLLPLIGRERAARRLAGETA
ncbi:Glutamate--tRNA ligase [Methylobacterium crusticola]|uniref:Glutamate--tRNA ligase n=1 Tax=Methylobacterium crusticola TaxID=1697972 RepID=A0ABQ4R5D4_9HYPH|nr:glutamate--tRNA ligase [Methylobacterium crusticola]GJD52920.1 Glutamate--tRNA ligase [Methylobacterium crusticola]